MTNPLDLNYIPCEKIDPSLVSAYIEFYLGPKPPTWLTLDSSWGETGVDLSDAFAGAGELLGTLRLSPTLGPTGVEIDQGKLGYSFVEGLDITRILYMAKLHDVDQTKPITDGDVLRFNGGTQLFEPFNLKRALADLDGLLTDLERRVAALEDLDMTVKLEEIRRRMDNIQDDLDELEHEDWGDIDYIDDSGQLQTYVFQSYADFREGGNFNVASAEDAAKATFKFAGLTIPKNRVSRLRIGTSVKKIPDWYGAFGVSSVTSSWKFTLDPLPDSIVEIGSDFFHLNTALSGGTTIPSSVKAIGLSFLSTIGKFTGPLVIETDVVPLDHQLVTIEQNAPLTTFNQKYEGYVKGITLTGTYAQRWKDAMVDSQDRKLIVK